MSGTELSAKKIEWWKMIFFHGSFAFMFAMALALFRERLYADSSYYIYKTIDTGFFVMPHQRIVLAISEILPLLFFYAGASLKTILLSWSAGHVLFYYVLLLIALYKFKSEEGAMAIILLQVIGQTWLYFSPMLEICYGAALMVIFVLLQRTTTLKPRTLFWLIVLEILILTSHPENFVVFFFVTGYDVLKNGFRKRLHLIYLVIFIALIIFKFLTFSDYEGGKIGYMTNLDQNHQYENLFKADYLKDVLKIFWLHYVDLIILFSIACCCLVYRKSYKLLGFTIAVIAGLIALINATNYAREFSRYNESLYSPVVTMIVVLIAFEIWPSVSSKFKIALSVLVLVIFMERFHIILKQGTYLNFRIFQIEELMREAHRKNVTKCLVNLENTEKDRWALNWSCPIESMLLSSMVHADSTVSVITDEDMAERDSSVLLSGNKVMVRRWDISEQSALRPFFHLKDENYKPFNTTDTLTNAEVFIGKMSLGINPQKFILIYNRLYMILNIENNSGHLLTSLPVESCFFKIICTTNEGSSESVIPVDIDVSSAYSEVVTCPASSSATRADVTIELIWMGKRITETNQKLLLN